MSGIRWLFAASVVALGACGHKGDGEKVPNPNYVTGGDRLDRARAGVGNAMVAPLRDVGLVKPIAPKMLSDIKFPYDLAELSNGCAQVTYEIGALDALLGKESYQPNASHQSLGGRGMDAAGKYVDNAAMSATTDFIPFRSWVRKASGAEKAERDQAHAIEMGQTRRSFLRGYGAAMGCRDVIPAAPPGATVQAQTPLSGVGAPP